MVDEQAIEITSKRTGLPISTCRMIIREYLYHKFLMVPSEHECSGFNDGRGGFICTICGKSYDDQGF